MAGTQSIAPSGRQISGQSPPNPTPASKISPWSALAVAVALAYPLLVWTGLAKIPPAAFVLLGILGIGIRIAATNRLTRSPIEIIVLLFAAAAVAVLLTISPTIAARAYPVAISLATATVFALSLRQPPTIIERIARLTQPNLPAAAIVYTRGVTVVWIGFLLINAAISLWTALWGTLNLWALWNGLLSYLAMGALFAGEYLIRPKTRA
ncbi:MAG TPA: hypothetical protein VH023_10070 [Rhodopila sp.]|nr:hypothetical protein [Rhodopila sp.]